MPFSRASFEMDAPGSQEAATSCCLNSGGKLGQPFRLPGVTFFCISDTLVPTTYLVDTTLSNSSDSDQTVQAVRLHIGEEMTFYTINCRIILCIKVRNLPVLAE